MRKPDPIISEEAIEELIEASRPTETKKEKSWKSKNKKFPKTKQKLYVGNKR